MGFECGVLCDIIWHTSWYHVRGRVVGGRKGRGEDLDWGFGRKNIWSWWYNLFVGFARLKCKKWSAKYVEAKKKKKARVHPLVKKGRRPRKSRNESKRKKEEGRTKRAGSGQPAIMLEKESSSHQVRKKRSRH